MYKNEQLQPWTFPTVICALCFIILHEASVEIISGGFHNCVFEKGRNETAMKCFGKNNNGELGLGDNNNRGDNDGEMGANLQPVDLGPDFDIDQVQLGAEHSCTVSQGQTMKCWGNGGNYQLGTSTPVNFGDETREVGSKIPLVAFGKDFVPYKVAAAFYHSCVSSTASLVCFGRNAYGECGAGTNETHIKGPPSNISVIDLGSNFTAVNISAFGEHVCALSLQQTMKCFGRNSHGQLGYGDTAHRGSTTQSMGSGLPEVSLGSNFTPQAVVTGVEHTCVLSIEKTFKCFGHNDNGQCGQGPYVIGIGPDEMGDNLPVVYLGADFVPLQVALGYYHTCILAQNAVNATVVTLVVCFGKNEFGQLGLGHTTSTRELGFNFTPVDLGTDFVPRRITAGYYHTCAVSTNDAIKCWGRNNHGQLGLGHSDNVGDGPNEMGDDLPIVNVCFGCTGTPTVLPTTTTPTSPAPTAPPATSGPTTADPTTSDPTTPDPTTSEPTTADPTITASTTIEPSTPWPVRNYSVTIRTDSLSSAQILIAVANAYNLSSTPLTITTVYVSSNDDEDDGFATVELLVAVANVQLDYDVIEATLREAMVEEYGDDIEVDIDVQDTQIAHESQVTFLEQWSWLLIVAACIASVCLCFAVVGVIKCVLGKPQLVMIDEDVDIEMHGSPLQSVSKIVDSDPDEQKEDVPEPGANGNDFDAENIDNKASVETTTATGGLAEDEFEVVDDHEMTTGNPTQ